MWPMLLWLSGCEGSDTSLADQVVAYAGDPYQVDRLAFTFVVEADGAEKVRRRHDWRPGRGELRVVSDGLDVAFTGLADGPGLSGWVDDPAAHRTDWARVASGADPDVAAKAWGAFINDSYWLLAPSKVKDPGVERTERDGVLELDFDGVGLTPGDHYELSVADDGRVTGWTYTLQSGREGAWSFEDDRQLGPLRLSLRRVSEGAVIWFDDVVVESPAL